MCVWMATSGISPLSEKVHDPKLNPLLPVFSLWSGCHALYGAKGVGPSSLSGSDELIVESHGGEKTFAGVPTKVAISAGM